MSSLLFIGDKRRRLLTIPVIPISVVFALAWYMRASDLGTDVATADETLAFRAQRLCRECGLEDREIKQLIDDCLNNKLNRQGLMGLWVETFPESDDHQELCRPCAEAVLDAAGV